MIILMMAAVFGGAWFVVSGEAAVAHMMLCM